MSGEDEAGGPREQAGLLGRRWDPTPELHRCPPAQACDLELRDPLSAVVPMGR